MKLQNLSVPLTLFAALVVTYAGNSDALAQSNSDGFETVLNVPPNPFVNGDTIGSNTQVNVLDGGSISSFLAVGASDGTDTNIEFNVFGGAQVTGNLSANSGGVVNVLGGSVGAQNIGGSLNARGGTINISDDSQIFFRLNASNGGEVNISGGTIFRLQSIDDATLNLTGGTVIGSSFDVDENAVLNVSGGELLTDGSSFRRRGTLNLTGGRVDRFTSLTTNISGGVVTDSISADEGRITGGRQQSVALESGVVLSGGEFLLNGEPVTGAVTLERDDSFFPSLPAGSPDVLTGTLADGTPFVFTSSDDRLNNVTLETVALPSNDTTPLSIGSGEVSTGVRTGQTLTVQQGGLVDESSSVVDAVLNVRGGTVADGLKLTGSVLAVEEGSVVGSGASAYDSDISVSGGQVGANLEVFSGTQLRLSGGTIGRGVTVNQGANATIVGGDVQLNGVSINESGVAPFVLGANDVLEGVFADGTPFVFSGRDEDSLGPVTLEQVSLPTASTTPIIVDQSTVNVPLGLRPGQTLTVEDGGRLRDDFTALDATLNIRGGQVSQATEIYRSTVNVSGGQFGETSDAFVALPEVKIQVRDNSTLMVFDGLVGIVEIDSGSTANVFGGSVERFDVGAGGEVNVEGGFVEQLLLTDDAVLNIFGGSVGAPFSGAVLATDEASINFFGTEFFIDGNLVDDLEFGESRLIDISSGRLELSGLFSDGSEFIFPIGGTPFQFNAGFSGNAQLSITRVASVPEPSSLPVILVLSLLSVSRRRAH